MNIVEIRERDTDGLRKLEAELQENLFALKFQKKSKQLENIAKLGLTRRDLARVKMVLHGRNRGDETQVVATEKAVKSEVKAAKSGSEKGTSKPTKKKASSKVSVGAKKKTTKKKTSE